MKTTKLKTMLLERKALPCPGVYDALSAIMAQDAGFKAVQISGYGITASFLGLTDYSFISLGEVAMITKNICAAVDIPVMADADTGFGNAVNAWWATKKLEEAGAAGMNIEDQLMPKRCGHMAGKTLIPVEEMVGKIRACVDARTDPDFVINARCDAIQVMGIDEAIRRANAYAEAGADMIFLESPNSVEEIKRGVREIKAPVSINMLQGGKTPMLTFSQLCELGVARVSVPLFSAFVTARALRNGFKYLIEHVQCRL